GNPLATIFPVLFCVHCRNKEAEIESSYFYFLKKNKCCAKHRDRKAEYQCKKCLLTLCPVCTYFKLKGLFRKRLGDGPYCLVCFRLTFSGHDRKRWISGYDIIKKQIFSI